MKSGLCRYPVCVTGKYVAVFEKIAGLLNAKIHHDVFNRSDLKILR